MFVCHGNICRSPTAEFVMKDILKRKIAAIEEDSNYQLYTKAETTQLMVEEISQLRNNISLLNISNKLIDFQQ